MKKSLSGLLIGFIFLILLGMQPVQAGPPYVDLKTGPVVIDSAVQTSLDSLQPGEQLVVILTLRQQADLSKMPGMDRAARLQGVIQALQATANTTQGPLNNFLAARRAQGLVSRFEPFWVFNGFSVTATGDVIRELSQQPDVFSISPDVLPIAMAAGVPEPNVSLVNAPALWDLGFTGQGVVVASMDSGVDASHPDLASRWRGGSNSWYDPYGQHPTTPTDLSGHGTETMGVMVAGDAGGTSIGVAPGAQWIAVKMFNDSGSATATAIHQGYQWLLDPDGDPLTADAPQVVNNSWTYGAPGCNLDFEPDLQALQAAGILPVFAAGNGGPSSSTSYSPANNPSALAVGAIDNSSSIYAYSSRGPSTCGGSTGPFPELVAPGVNIKSTSLYGIYTSDTGTSLAAPHVSGALALLLSAFPGLTVGDQGSALINSAVDLGAAGPDDTYGYGRLDVLGAYDWLAAGNHATPTPAPTDAPTPTPTPTPTATPTPTLGAPVNLALNRPVAVSSFLDSSTTGDMAVDGDQATFWQTAKAAGRNKLSAERITVDLGASMTVGEVVLLWDSTYATAYEIQVSSDNTNWTSVFSTSSGDGAADTIAFPGMTARYVQMYSTAWSSGQRVALQEFEVYAMAGSAPTPTPTQAPTPTPTPTLDPGGTGTMHLGALSGNSVAGSRGRWDATVTVTVHDASHNPVSDATVSGVWDVGGSGSCVTVADGTCSIAKPNIKGNVTSATFTLTGMTHASYTYDLSANEGFSEVTINAP